MHSANTEAPVAWLYNSWTGEVYRASLVGGSWCPDEDRYGCLIALPVYGKASPLLTQN